MSEPSLRETFGNYLAENGEKYKNMVVLDADLSSSTRTFKFAKLFPDRFFNMGIAEQNMLGSALGLAISGKTPIVSGFSIFTTGRAWEFIRFACHDNLNIKIITTHGGIVGEDGSTHNALEDLSIMSTLPNLSVLVPSDNLELIQILNHSLNTRGPVYIRLPRDSFPNIHDNNYNFSIGEPDILKEGNDICIIGNGYGGFLGLKASKLIEEQHKLSIKVINLPSVKPINQNRLINAIKTIKGVIVIEEHNIYCGLGSILARIISEIKPLPMRFVGINNSFCQSGKRKEILENQGLNVRNVVEQVNILINNLDI